MSNIFSHSTDPPFSRQSIDEYFIQPMFMAEDIRGMITVRTDIKGTERLNRVYRPGFLTQPKLEPGFNPKGELGLYHTNITVQPMALEFEQNARAFWGSIVEQLLASGYREDDVEQLKSPDIWNKIMLPIIAQAGQDDLLRQMFFADPTAELPFSSEGDPNHNGYTGFMTHLLNDYRANNISSAQNISINTSEGGSPQIDSINYDGAEGDFITITINGENYSSNFINNSATTLSNWLNTYKSEIEARAGINGVWLYLDGEAIIITSKYLGSPFNSSCSLNGEGEISSSTQSQPILPGKLAENEADYTLESMLDAATPEMLSFDLAFMVTNSIYRNLAHTFKNRVGSLGDKVLQNGLKVPTYEGIPIFVRPDWDKWIKVSNLGVAPHRAILTTPKNLLFATDGTSDSEMVESWYNQEAQMRRYRVQYKAQTAYLHPELVVLGGFDPYIWD